MRRLIFLLLILCLTSSCFALQKNVASQKWTIFAFDRTDNTAKTGDLSQITGSIWIDGVENVIGDTNPTELAHGYYEFDLDQAETNGNYLVMDAVSSTGNIQVVGAPMAVWVTAPYFSVLSIDSNGRLDIIKVAGTTQTANDMSGDIDTITTAVGNIETDTSAYDTDAEHASAIWDALMSSYSNEASMGGELQQLDPNITFILADTAAQDTSGELRTLLTGADTPVAKETSIATAQSDLDTITGASGVIIADGLLTAAKFGADFLTAAKIADDAFAAEHFATNALTNDALDATWVTEIWATAMVDLSAGAPSMTASVKTALNWLYSAWLNKVITNGTNSEIEYYNFAGTKIAEAPIADDGTNFIKSKVGAVD